MALLTETVLLVLDTETTGPDPETDRVVELGCAYFHAGALACEPMRALINPGTPIPAEASAVHGIRDEDVADAPPFAAIADELVAHIAGRSNPTGEPPVLVGYNARRFDVPILLRELAPATPIDAARVVDPYVWIAWHHRDKVGKLGVVAAAFGVSLDNAHSAAADAVATGELLLRLVESTLIPNDVDEALAECGRLAALLAEERAAWSYYFYADRETGLVRVGFGKHKGRAVDEVPADYFRFCLAKFDIPTGDARALFEEMAPWPMAGSMSVGPGTDRRGMRARSIGSIARVTHTAIAFELRRDGYDVVGCDIREGAVDECHRGGMDLSDLDVLDFLADDLVAGWSPVACVTNPPFSAAEDFARRCFGVAPLTIFLLPLDFLATVGRGQFWRAHPADVLVLDERPSFTGGGTASTNYGWFAWPPMSGERGQVFRVGDFG